MLFKQRNTSGVAEAAADRGQDVSIAVLDTGISPVADFILPQNRILAFLDLVNGKTKPYDDNGHGTHLTGTKRLTARCSARAP